MSSETHRAKVLLLYINAPEDDELQKQLDQHMSSLRRRGLIEGWSTADILAGSDKKSALDQHLQDADIILLLISPNLISSDALYHVEVLPALARHEAGEARVFSILLRPTHYRGLPFFDTLQWLPTAAQAASVWSDRERDLAFSHIAESIDQIIQGEEKPFFHPTSTLPHLWSVPYRNNPFFTARQRELDELHNRFTHDRDSPLAVQAITGLPGLGKTELAIEYCIRFRHEYEAIFWLRCDSLKNTITDFLHIAHLLQLPVESTSEEENAMAKVKQRLADFNGRWLLIFDNVLDMSSLDDLIPNSLQGDVLLTTTESIVGTVARPLELIGMNEEEGARFLIRRARMSSPDSDHLVEAKEISRLVAGLPLALDQVGAYIEGTGKSFSDYIQNYHVWLNNRGQHGPSRHPMTVTATFSLCFEQIKHRNLIAAEILQLCAFLSAEAIPEKLFMTGIPEFGSVLQLLSYDQLEEALKELQRYSLVARNNGKLSVHRLVQLVLKERLDEEEKRQYASRAVCAVNVIFPEANFTFWPLCQSYLPQVQACAELMEQWQEVESAEGAYLLDKAGYYLYEQSQYAAARSFFEQALKIQQRVLGKHHADTVRTLTHLGALSRSLGQYPEAEKYYKDALAMFKYLSDQVPLAKAWILDGQGELAQTRDDYLAAQRFYKQALAIRKRHLEPGHPDIAASLANLAGISEELRNVSQAGSLYEQALTIYEQVLVPQHPDIALVLGNFARFCGTQKEYARAELLFERAKTIREHVFGAGHPKVAGTLHNLASLYIDLGDSDKYITAEQYISQALVIWEQTYGTRMHPNVAASLRILAKLYQKRRHYTDAELNYEQALAIYKNLPEPKPLAIAQIYNDLEALHRDQEKDG